MNELPLSESRKAELLEALIEVIRSDEFKKMLEDQLSDQKKKVDR